MSEAENRQRLEGRLDLGVPSSTPTPTSIRPTTCAWKDYLPNALKDRAPVIEHGEDCDYIVFEGNRRPATTINNQAGREGKDFKMKGRLSEQRNTYDPQSLTRRHGPGRHRPGGDLLRRRSARHFRQRALHRQLRGLQPRRYWNGARTRRTACSRSAYVLMRDVDETIEHVHRLAKMGFKMSASGFPAEPGKLDFVRDQEPEVRTGFGADRRSQGRLAVLPA